MYYDSEEVRDQVRIDVMRFALGGVTQVERLSDEEVETLWDAFLTALNEWWGRVKATMEEFVEMFTAWAQRIAAVFADAATAFKNLGLEIMGITGLEPQQPRHPHWREHSRRPNVRPARTIDPVKAGRRMLYHQARRS